MGLIRLLLSFFEKSDSNSYEPPTRTKSVCQPYKPSTQTKSINRLNKSSTRHENEHVQLPVFPEVGVLEGKCHVIDGDTIVIKRTKIRLAGIDAPELDKPWGQKSKWAMVQIVKGQVVTAKLNGEHSHDRLVATCYLPDGRDIGAELIGQGLALDWTKFSGGKYKHLEPKGVRRKLKWAHHQ
jgi:endonuclease YncB( thermonuclease family)